MALVITVVLFPLVGAATAVLLRIPLPAPLAARLALLFLLGAGMHGALLFAFGPWALPVVLASGALASRRLSWRRPAPPPGRAAGGWLLIIPLIVLFLAAAVIPIRDYDGRVTWLPKARAIALDGSTAGPFFQGERGLNLHNRYPLLLPLDAATVMRLSNDTRNEAARWLYVLIPIALFVILGTMLPSPWIAAALPWLGVVAALEGGALSAYNDLALAAFFGLAVLSLLDDDARTAGLFAAFAVLTKNEGLTLAIALLGAALVTRRFRLWLLVPVVLAEGIVLAWRVRVPAAYDEQYEVLLATLPSKLERVPAALAAIGRHMVSFPEWGIFWIAVAVAAVVAGRRVALPLVAMALALAAYVAALCVTSWRIEDLAPVAVNRLLLHLLVPAAYVLAAALASRNTEPKPAVTPDP